MHIGTAQMVAVCLLMCYGGLVLGVLLQVLQHGGGEALRCSVSETLSKMSTMISSVLQGVITKQNIGT